MRGRRLLVRLTCPHFPHTDHTTFWSCLVSRIPVAGAVGMWETPEANAEAFSKAALSPAFPQLAFAFRAANWFGVRYPKLLCGRSSLYATLHSAILRLASNRF